MVQAREAGVTEERQRMAGEIHDTLAQGLTGIIAQLEAADHTRDDEGELSRHLGQAAALARSSLTEARRSVRALRPGQLEQASLPEALAELARGWSEQTGVAARLDTTGTPVRAGADVEAALFRVTQEALSNVAKHAQAGRVQLTLSYTGDMLLLDVADDGTVGAEPRRRGQPERRVRPDRHGAAAGPRRRHAHHRVRPGLGHHPQRRGPAHRAATESGR